MNCTEDGFKIIRHFEQLHDGDLHKIGLQPKMCPAGIWTRGYGHAMKNEFGKPLRGLKNKAEAYRQCESMTVEEAEELLREDVREVSNAIRPMIKAKLTDNEFSALVSLAFNIGIDAFRTSTVLRSVNEGKKRLAVASMQWWNKSTLPTGKKVVMNGLVRRRKTEAALFMGEYYERFFV